MRKDGYSKIEEAGYLYLSNKILSLNQSKYTIMLVSLLFSMVSLVSLIAIKIFYNQIFWQSLIGVFLGLISIVTINYLPKFFEMISYSYPMKIKVGCRVLGGVDALPVSIIQNQGPLSGTIAQYIKKKKFTAKEFESYKVLSQEWDGNFKDLIAVIYSLNKQSPA